MSTPRPHAHAARRRPTALAGYAVASVAHVLPAMPTLPPVGTHHYLRGTRVELTATEGDRVRLFTPDDHPSEFHLGLLLHWLGAVWRVEVVTMQRGNVVLEYWGRTYLESPKLPRWRSTGAEAPHG